MLRGVGAPIDVHEIDEALMREAIARLADFPSFAASGSQARTSRRRTGEPLV
jgi:hypothetical protein